MNRKYEVEALLRPAVESYSAGVALFAAIAAVFAPHLFMMPPPVAYGSALVLAVFVVYPRSKEALHIIKYQRNLKQLPKYILASKEIPVSQYKLFLGRGFFWEQIHTQRLRDTMKAAAAHYTGTGAFYRWARNKEVAWENTLGLSLLALYFRADVWWNIVRPLPAVGGDPVLHAVEPGEQDMFLNMEDRAGHTLILGTTGVGKTRCAETFLAQDIRRGDVTIVFDPKGDVDLLKRMYAEAKAVGREGKFYIFHLGFPKNSCRYNAIGSFSRTTEVAGRISNQLPKEGNAAAFREFAWRFVNAVARALVALDRRPDYVQIRQHINNIESLFIEYATFSLNRWGDKNWADQVETIRLNIDERNLPFNMRGRKHHVVALWRYLTNLNPGENTAIDQDPVLDGLKMALTYDRTYFDKIVSSLGPLLDKLTTGQIAELLSPDYFDIDDPRPILDWQQVIREGGIVYVGLDALTDTVVSAAVGNSMFADLVSVAGEIYKHGIEDGLTPSSNNKRVPRINLHADEFSELIGDEFIPLLNKSRGAGVNVTAYTQTWSDIEARMGNRAKAGQVTGNFNTLIMMRVKQVETADLLTKQLPEVEIHQLMSVSGVNDSSTPDSGAHFTSRNEDRVTTQRVEMLSINNIMNLPKGQAFALIQGGRLIKLRLPLPKPSGKADLPDNVASLTQEMERSRTTNDQWFAERDTWWTQVIVDGVESATRDVVEPAAQSVTA